jgi:hypothetical protein
MSSVMHDAFLGQVTKNAGLSESQAQNTTDAPLASLWFTTTAVPA